MSTELLHTTDALSELKSTVLRIGGNYNDRFHRARRLFVEERAAALAQYREEEYAIKTKISEHFGIEYSSISFTGSSQLGFSIHKNKLFEPAMSDLDIACIDPELYHRAWADIVSTTRAFTDLTPFSGHPARDIELLKDNILRRAMIRIKLMPRSRLSTEWSDFQNMLGRRHAKLFGGISIAIYMNEYAFCWKQDTSLTKLFG